MSPVRFHGVATQGVVVRGQDIRFHVSGSEGEDGMRWLFRRQLCCVSVSTRAAATVAAVLAVTAAAPAAMYKSHPMDYRVFSTENFDVYVADPRLEPVWGLVEEVLEDAHVRHTALFDVQFERRVPFFLFYGDEQFFQNTVVPVSEGTGGVTEAFKNRFLVPWMGSFKTFQHVVMHELVHEVQFEVLYSGFWRTPLIAKSFLYPSWMMEGLAEYGSRWLVRSTMETAVRDLAVDDALIPLEHLHNFAHLKPRQVLPAYEQSAMFMEYLATEYGENRLVDILKLFREKFDANGVLLPVVNAPLRDLDRKFREEMVQRYRYEVSIASMTDPDPLERISQPAAFAVHYDAVCLWRDTALYFGDPDGRPAIYATAVAARPAGNRHPQRVLVSPGRLRRCVDVLHRERLTVSRDGVLCFTGIKDNRSWVFLYDIPSGTWERHAVPGVDVVTSAAIAPAGDLIVVAGVTRGVTDLHLLHRRNGYLRRLTDDAAHEADPVFSPDGTWVAYVREVPCIKRDPVTGDGVRTVQTDIFMNAVSGGERRLTDTLGDERWPCFASTDTLVYVSDHHAGYAASLSGVRNVWSVRTDGSRVQRITNVIGATSHPAAADGVLAYVYYRKTEQHVYAARWKPSVPLDGTVVVDAPEGNVWTQQTTVSPLPGGSPERSFPPLPLSRRSPMPVSAGISTDLFFPFLMYTTGGGLSALLYWQASDMVGENFVTLFTNVLGTSNIAYTLTGENRRFRPVLFAGASGQHYDDPFLRLRVDEDLFQVGVRYPLSTAAQLQVLFGYPYRRLTAWDTGASSFRSENVVLVGYEYSDVSGAYLEPLRGSYHQLSWQAAGAYIDGDYSYELYRYTGGTYLHLGWQHVLSLRVAGGVSRGRDAPVFPLGGPGAVRGGEALGWSARTLVAGSIAYHVPVVRDINYYLWFLFPDLFFKSMHATVFSDIGLDVENTSRLLASYGAGLRLHTFVLQTFPLVFDVSVARLQGRGDLGWVTYFVFSGGW